MRKRIYIACPISMGDWLHNARQADEAFFILLKAGFAPFNPIWSAFAGSAHRIDERLVLAEYNPTPAGTVHEDWMGADLPWVAVADAVLRLPGSSTGADQEVAHAKGLGVPVFMSIDELIDELK